MQVGNRLYKCIPPSFLPAPFVSTTANMQVDRAEETGGTYVTLALVLTLWICRGLCIFACAVACSVCCGVCCSLCCSVCRFPVLPPLLSSVYKTQQHILITKIGYIYIYVFFLLPSSFSRSVSISSPQHITTGGGEIGILRKVRRGRSERVWYGLRAVW